jgi:molybdenum cofactor cytidylyltransferase
VNRPQKPAAIILAAGESLRMGRAKAYLPFRGGTFLSAIAGTLGRRCHPVIVVFGFDAQRLKQSAPHTVIPIENPDYQQGMLTSLQAGLRALSEAHDDACGRVLFTLVDHPAVSSATVDAVLQSHAPIAIPRFRNKRGHPVLIRAEIMAEFLREPATSKVRDVIDRHAREIDYIEVADPGIQDDIDDPALYEKLLAREAARV